METVESIRKPDQDLTIHLVHGPISAGKMIAVDTNHHIKDSSLKVLWDFSASDFSRITSEDILELIQAAKKYEHLRPGGKTAMVFFRKADFGMGRMLEILSGIENLKFSIKPFYDLVEAVSWLEGQDWGESHQPR